MWADYKRLTALVGSLTDDCWPIVRCVDGALEAVLTEMNA